MHIVRLHDLDAVCCSTHFTRITPHAASLGMVRKPEPIGQPYTRRGRVYVLTRLWREKLVPVVSRDSSAVIGYVRRVEWYVKDIKVKR